MKPETISNCFKKAGFIVEAVASDIIYEQNENDTSGPENWNEVGSIPIIKFGNVGDHVINSGEKSDEEIIAL